MGSGKLELKYEVMCAAGAATCCVVVTNPMEVVKTRLQLQGEGRGGVTTAVTVPNPVRVMGRIFKEEGVRGVQAGLVSGILYQQAMNGTRLGLFDHMKAALDWIPNEFARSATAGALTGAAGALVASPFFQVKVRLQTGAEKSMVTSVSSVLKEEGPRGLFRGSSAAMLRVAVGSAAQLSSFDTCKRYIQRLTGLDGMPLWLSSSLGASFLVVAAMNPFDVVSTRLYAAPPGKYRGVIHCFAVALRHEGLSGLYKGSIAHYLRLGPHTILTLSVWEQFRRWTTLFLLHDPPQRSPPPS